MIFNTSSGEGHASFRYDGAFLNGKNLAVTLGTWGTGPNSETGTFAIQFQSFDHEMGHLISLMHGGVDHVLYKPNYVSVMNYAYQFCPPGQSGHDADGRRPSRRGGVPRRGLLRRGGRHLEQLAQCRPAFSDQLPHVRARVRRGTADGFDGSVRSGTHTAGDLAALRGPRRERADADARVAGRVVLRLHSRPASPSRTAPRTMSR